MTARTVTLELPTALYDRIRQSAKRAHHSVEEEVQRYLDSALLVGADLPPDIAAEIMPLAFLSDDELWSVARRQPSLRDIRALRRFRANRADSGLTEAEEETEAQILAALDRVTLARAHAAMLLKHRGHDIADLGPQR
jgi:hypothetical protein